MLLKSIVKMLADALNPYPIQGVFTCCKNYTAKKCICQCFFEKILQYFCYSKIITRIFSWLFKSDAHNLRRIKQRKGHCFIQALSDDENDKDDDFITPYTFQNFRPPSVSTTSEHPCWSLCADL